MSPRPTGLRRAGLVLAMATPILSLTDLHPESLRRIILSLAGALIAAGLVWDIARTGKAARPAGAFFWTGAAFIAWCLFESLEAVNLYRTLAPLSAIVAGLAIYLSLAIHPEDRAHLIRTLRSGVPTIALLISLAGFAQSAGLRDWPILKQSSESAAPASFFFNSNYGGTFAGILMPLAVCSVLTAGSRRRQILPLAGLFVLSIYLLLSASRAGQLAMTCGLLSSVLVCLWRFPGMLRWRSATLCATVIALGLWIGYIALGERERPYYVNRHVSTRGINARMSGWKASLKQLRQHPVEGAGLGNFRAVFHTLADREFFADEPSVMSNPAVFGTFTEPHSDYVLFLTETGLVGGALFAALVVLGIAGFLRRAGQARGDPDALWLAAAFGSVVAYAMAAGFNTLALNGAHWVYLWVALGLLQGTTGTTIPMRSTLPAIALPGCAALFLGAMVLLHGTLSVSRWITRGPARRDPVLVERGLSIHPWDDTLHREAAKRWVTLKEPRKALDHWEQLLAWEPGNPTYLLQVADARLSLGDTTGIEDLLRQSAERAPLWGFPRRLLAIHFTVQNRFQEAFPLFAEVIALHPEWPDVRWEYGMALAEAGRFPEAVTQLREAKRLGFDVPAALRKHKSPWVQRPEFQELLR